MKNNNLYNYSTPKSGNEETNFFNIKGRITMTAFFARLLFAVGIYSLSWVIFNQGIYTWFGVRIENFFETIHLYILPLILIAFVLIQGAKRVHDVNKSGWLFLIPFYNVYLSFCRGTIGSNNYGIDPKPMAQVNYFDELETNIAEVETHSPLKQSSNFNLIFGLLFVLIIFLIVYDGYDGSNAYSKTDTIVDSLSLKSVEITKHKKYKHKKHDNNIVKKENPDEILENPDEILQDANVTEDKGNYDVVAKTIDKYYTVLSTESKPVYFYLTPNTSDRTIAFPSDGDPAIVHANNMKNGFVYVEYIFNSPNFKNQTFRGWLQISDLK
jgi:uncharacterized membrane protein YhaH (DUF805 family)